jgi:hypothetical protein
VSSSSSAWSRRLRNPWFLAALGGAILIPLIRPLTRRVPEPPPVSGQLAPFELLTGAGPFGSRQLADHVYLASVVGPRCDSACEARLEAMAQLQQRCRRFGVKLWLLTLTTASEPGAAESLRSRLTTHGGQDSPPGHRWVVGSARDEGERRRLESELLPEVRRAIQARGAAAKAVGAQLEAWGVLVDGDGGLRGAYPLDRAGLYEVFHRAQRVMALKRAWR